MREFEKVDMKSCKVLWYWIECSQITTTVIIGRITINNMLL